MELVFYTDELPAVPTLEKLLFMLEAVFRNAPIRLVTWSIESDCVSGIVKRI
jgi:hypothetical protein